MGLILTSYLQQSLTQIQGLSNQYFVVPKKYLSMPFKLTQWNKISGVILEINTQRDLDQEDRYILNQLKDYSIILYLNIQFFGTNDLLYLSDESWNHIRDYGILPNEFYFTIFLREIQKDDESILIYPKRDVTVIF